MIFKVIRLSLKCLWLNAREVQVQLDDFAGEALFCFTITCVSGRGKKYLILYMIGKLLART